jgi:hypothetical protein
MRETVPASMETGPTPTAIGMDAMSTVARRVIHIAPRVARRRPGAAVRASTCLFGSTAVAMRLLSVKFRY